MSHDINCEIYCRHLAIWLIDHNMLKNTESNIYVLDLRNSYNSLFSKEDIENLRTKNIFTIKDNDTLLCKSQQEKFGENAAAIISRIITDETIKYSSNTKTRFLCNGRYTTSDGRIINGIIERIESTQIYGTHSGLKEVKIPFESDEDDSAYIWVRAKDIYPCGQIKNNIKYFDILLSSETTPTFVNNHQHRIFIRTEDVLARYLKAKDKNAIKTKNLKEQNKRLKELLRLAIEYIDNHAQPYGNKWIECRHEALDLILSEPAED